MGSTFLQTVHLPSTPHPFLKRIFPFSLALAGLALAFIGCTSKPRQCEGSLADVGRGCPAMFDGTPEQVPPCPSAPVSQSVGHCEGLVDLSQGGYVGSVCYYDTASHLLVGAKELSDTTDFCGNSFSRTAGRTPGTVCSDLPSFQRQCPAGTGVDAGSID